MTNKDTTQQVVSLTTVSEAITQVIKAVSGTMTKDCEMREGARYKYLSIEKIVSELQPALIAAGIVIAPEQMEVIHERIDVTRSGSQMQAARVLVTYRVIGPSGDSIIVQTIGEGRDSGDKTMNKAMTAAFKYCLMELFFLAQGDDPDHEASEKTQSSSRQGRPASTQRPSPSQQPSPSQPSQPKVTGSVIRDLGDLLKAKFAGDKDKMQTWAAGIIGIKPWNEMSPDEAERIRNLLTSSATGDELLANLPND